MRRRLIPLFLFLLLGLASTVVVAALLAVFLDVHEGPQSQAESLLDDERWTITRWDRAGAAQLRSVRVRGLNWSPQQAAGEPDTPSVGDHVTAWASQSSDAGTEWLVLHYARPVVPRELHVYESCGPGALFKVAALDDAGTEHVAWTGADPSAAGTGPKTPGGVPISKVPLALPFATNRIKIYLACEKVPNWNEIDAVGLVDDKGDQQWARHVQASSTYASASSAQAGAAGNPALLAPAWSTVDRALPAFQAGAANREERIVDARGWPLLALRSEIDLLAPASPPAAVVTKNVFSQGLQVRTRALGGGAIAVTTPPAAGVRPPLPVHPVWTGLAVNTLFYTTIWLTLWAVLTLPRRFVRDLMRLRRGACIACGYDLGYDFIHGCPECGWRRDPASTQRAPHD